MNLVALLLLTSHLFIVSCIDAGQVILVVSNITRSFVDMEAGFSPSMNKVETGVVYVAEPLDACRNLKNKLEQSPNGTSPFVLIVRGGCTFEYKVRNAQKSGFKAAIVYDNVDRNFLSETGDSDGIKIQAVSVTKAAGETLKMFAALAETEVILVPSSEDPVWSSFMIIALITSLAIFVVLIACVFIYRHCTTLSNSTSQFHGMSRRMVKAMPSVTFTCAKEDNTTALSCAICREDYTTALSCAICREDYSVGDKLRVLPCSHKFHDACVDSWLTLWRTFCPVCKRDVKTSADEPPASESTPLLRTSIATSAVVFIDQPPLGSPVCFSPPQASSSYIQKLFRSSSHSSRYSPMNVSHHSADLRQQASPSLQSSSERSYISCMKSLHSLGYSTMSPLNAIDNSPYRPTPSNTSPGLATSTNHRFHPLPCNHTPNTFIPFVFSHSLPYC